MTTHIDAASGETIYTCPLCSESMLYWQEDAHNTRKHNADKFSSFTYSVEGSRDWTCCEGCAVYIINNWELVKNPYASQWLAEPAKYESDICITQNFSYAKLFESGCDLCHDRLS